MDSRDVYIKSLEETVDRLQKELEDALAREIESSTLIDTPVAIGYHAGASLGTGHKNMAVGAGALSGSVMSGSGSCISAGGMGVSSRGIGSGCVTSAKVPSSNTASAHTSFMDFMKEVNDA